MAILKNWKKKYLERKIVHEFAVHSWTPKPNGTLKSDGDAKVKWSAPIKVRWSDTQTLDNLLGISKVQWSK